MEFEDTTTQRNHLAVIECPGPAESALVALLEGLVGLDQRRKDGEHYLAGPVSLIADAVNLLVEVAAEGAFGNVRLQIIRLLARDVSADIRDRLAAQFGEAPCGLPL